MQLKGSQVFSSAATREQVADNAADVLLLDANPDRVGVSIFNDSTAALYVGLGIAAVTTTNYSVMVGTNAFFETPFGYTGEIRGIWASDPGDGGARITEFS